MVDVLVKMNDQTDGTHDTGILKVQTRIPTKKDPSPEVFWADFDNVFAIYKFQAINIAEPKPFPGIIFAGVHTSIKSK